MAFTASGFRKIASGAVNPTTSEETSVYLYIGTDNEATVEGDTHWDNTGFRLVVGDIIFAVFDTGGTIGFTAVVVDTADATGQAVSVTPFDLTA